MQFRCKGEEANEGSGRGVRGGGVGAHLILVELAVLVGGLSLVLEGDDDETDEDVDHEEGENDDVDDVEDGHVRTVVVHGTHVLGVRVDGHVQDAKEDVKDFVDHSRQSSRNKTRDYAPGPALERADDEQREDALEDVVEVERVALPHPLLHHGVIDVVVRVHDVVALALLLHHLAAVGAHEELPLEHLQIHRGGQPDKFLLAGRKSAACRPEGNRSLPARQ